MLEAIGLKINRLAYQQAQAFYKGLIGTTMLQLSGAERAYSSFIT